MSWRRTHIAARARPHGRPTGDWADALAAVGRLAALSVHTDREVQPTTVWACAGSSSDGTAQTTLPGWTGCPSPASKPGWRGWRTPLLRSTRSMRPHRMACQPPCVRSCSPGCRASSPTWACPPTTFRATSAGPGASGQHRQATLPCAGPLCAHSEPRDSAALRPQPAQQVAAGTQGTLLTPPAQGRGRAGRAGRDVPEGHPPAGALPGRQGRGHGPAGVSPRVSLPGHDVGSP